MKKNYTWARDLTNVRQIHEGEVDTAYQQLKRIFPFVDKNKEIKGGGGASTRADLVAYSASGQAMVFVVEKVPSGTTLGYYAYPKAASLRDEVADISPESHPIVVLLAVGRLNDEVQNLFMRARIPLVSMGPNYSETRVRLHDALQRHNLYLPEFASMDDDASKTYQSAPAESDVATLVRKLGESERAQVLVFLAVLALMGIGGAFFAFHEKIWWAELASVVITIPAIAIFSFISYKEGKKTKTLNPYLIVEKDDRKLFVKSDEWVLTRQVLFKARRNRVEKYLFRVDWSGSSQDVKIVCRNHAGSLSRKTFVSSNGLHRQLWELKFDEPMKKGEPRSITLEHIFHDPEHVARRFHSFSYLNVWKCKEFYGRLEFAKNLTPKAVYFVQGTNFDVPLKKEEVPRVLSGPDTKDYVIHGENPDAKFRYSIEWELGNGNGGFEHKA